MDMNRRGLLGAAALPLIAATASSEAGPSRAWTTGADAYGHALEQLRGYVEEHRQAYSLPGLTLVVADANGYTGFITSGWSDVEIRKPVQAGELFEIGSISKSFTSLCLFKAVEGGKVRLDDDVRDHLTGLRIDTPDKVTLQSLLNHSSGLPDGAPLFPRVPEGGLWLGYTPGSRWSYSNTGYSLLTLVLETLQGEPLETIIAREVFAPLGIQGARAAVRLEDQDLYAAGYWPAMIDQPYPRGGALARAPFGEELSGAGCVAMATPQMARYLRWLIQAGRGQGAPLLSDAAVRRWSAPTIDAPGWSEGAKYANGLAVVQVDGRTLLHHTGGMTSFSSSMHIDPEAGVACFASTNVGATGYRPRAITSWACSLFQTAAARTGAPEPKSTALEVDKPGDYAGVFQARNGERLVISPSAKGLQLGFGAETCALEPSGDDAFLAHHPRFARYAFLIERKDGKPVAAWWGEQEFAADPARLRGPAPPEFAVLAGRYDDVFSTSRVVARPTGLFMDGVTPMTRLADGGWRVGADDWSPERLRFDAMLNGRPQRLNASGSDTWRVTDRA